jgi:hypothetical protein
MFTFRETEGLAGMTWCLRFTVEHFPDWKDKFTIYLWEGKNKVSYAKAKADEQKYIQAAYEDEDVEMKDAEEEEEVPEEEEQEEAESEPEEEESEDESETESFGKGAKNEQLAVGYKNDLSFVGRGDMIGVFAHKNDKFKFRTAIDRVKDLEGKAFSPKKVCRFPSVVRQPLTGR